MVPFFLLKKALRSDAISLITNFNLPITVTEMFRKLLDISQKEAFYSHINKNCGTSNSTIQLLGSAQKKKLALFMKSRFSIILVPQKQTVSQKINRRFRIPLLLQTGEGSTKRDIYND